MGHLIKNFLTRAWKLFNRPEEKPKDFVTLAKHRREAIPLVNVSPSTIYTVRSEGETTTHEYIQPDSRLVRPERQGSFEFEENLEPVVPRSAAVENWDRRNARTRHYYRKPNPDTRAHDPNIVNIRRLLDEQELKDVMKMLHNFKIGLMSDDVPIQIAYPMEWIVGAPEPPQIPMSMLIEQLDRPFEEWFNDRISDEQLAEFYGETLIPEPKHEFRLPLWVIILPALILVILMITGFFIWKCSDTDCFAWLPSTKEAASFELKTLPLMNASHYLLKESSSGIEVFARNTTDLKEMYSLDVKINFSRITPVGEWKRRQHNSDCQLIENRKNTNCSIFHPFFLTKSDHKDGHFLGDKSYTSSENLYLYSCSGDCEGIKNGPTSLILYKWKSDGSKLMAYGALQPFLDEKKLRFWDGIFDSAGNGLVLLGKPGKQELCEIGLTPSKGVPRFYGGKCSPVDKLPCSSNDCNYLMKRCNSKTYLLISEPTNGKGNIIVSAYDLNTEQLLDRAIETPLHAKEILYIKRDFEPFMICYVEHFNLVCRAYSKFVDFSC